MARIGIGIDTGGTYTDAVAYDLTGRTVLATAKALTTRHDLAVGIAGALDALPRQFTSAPAVIALSTTLATNACVENRMGRAKLYFFGGDRRYLEAHGREYGLPPADDIAVLARDSSYSEGTVGEVDWDGFTRAVDTDAAGLDGIGIIELYAMRNGACVEKRAKEIAAERTGIPVVCGHELVSDLNALQRGSSTLVNASLFPTIHAFLEAIKTALAARGIAAPLVIVRSDGNLMNESFASLRPAETLLCGPAASAMGAMELARTRECVVVDMGGTTSDIAVIRAGEPVTAKGGIGIGRWKTFIKGLSIRTFGLGGDTAIHYADTDLFLEDYRVVPLCIAASEHPGLLDRLRAVTDAYPTHTRPVHEGFVRVRDIAGNSRYSDFEQAFAASLADGPLPLREAALAVGKDEYSLDVSRLVRDGVVQVFGLTPTDIMHIRGEFTRYSREAAELGASFVAANLGVTVDEVCIRAYEEVRKRLYLNIVMALMEHEYPAGMTERHAESLRALAMENYRRIKSGGNGFVTVDFTTALPLVGIGAPTHLFLADVAAMLGTTAVVPEHAEVANALGAVVGRVHARSEVAVRANYHTDGIDHYTVYGIDETRTFTSREAAEEYAIAKAKREAAAEAVRRGAAGDVAVDFHMESHTGDTRDGSLYLGSRAIAHAVGSMQF
ncbi:MAG: hydantoinase/oxoprolinase family protein [Planctomycetaceae bacterium]|nr:hydantoinase/oxoprolinase family protein [Planctomycetaceae bacterium]